MYTLRFLTAIIVPDHNYCCRTGIFGRKDNYETLEKLGEGSYATVYKGRFKCPFTAIREASLLKGLQHANIVSLHDIIYNKEYLIFVFEYVNNIIFVGHPFHQHPIYFIKQKDLGRYLEKYPNGIHPHNAKLYLYQLLRGLAYCHDKKILHRDMKPQNLLISDAGLARAKSVPSHTYSHEVVTLWYRPPDVLLGSTTYSTSLDMWGVGCILAEMIMGNALFPGAKDVFDQLDKIFRIMGTPNESTFKGVEKLPNYLPLRTIKELSVQGFFNQYSARDPLRISPKIDAIQFCGSLLSSFLKMIPATRISASDAMNHAYFCDLPSQIHTLSHKYF
uniref:Protein kinase domain-containing protein n=1 Tax=Romanomermis culicivorax TaxID=13658 RepID=A0A915KU45_ROMCU